MRAIHLIRLLALAPGACLLGQPNFFNGSNVSGRLALSASINLLHLAQTPLPSAGVHASTPITDELDFRTAVRRPQPGAARILSDRAMRGRLDQGLIANSTPRITATSPLMQSSP